MINCMFNRHFVVSAALLLLVTLTLSSCEPLRKKFTRKKKASQMESVDFQPVLEPQEYIAPERNASEVYKQHYALIKSWYRDLWAGINERATDGSVKYSLKQVADHLEQMKALLKADKAKELDELNGLLAFYKTSLDQPRAMRNYSRIQSDLRAFDRMLRAKFRVDVVKPELGG